MSKHRPWLVKKSKRQVLEDARRLGLTTLLPETWKPKHRGR